MRRRFLWALFHFPSRVIGGGRNLVRMSGVSLKIFPVQAERERAYPTVSCLCEIGMTPARLVRPTVGLMPTTKLQLHGHKIEPSVSVPSDTAAIFAATDIAGPLLDPQGPPIV